MYVCGMMGEQNELTSNTVAVFGRVLWKIVETTDENEEIFVGQMVARLERVFEETCAYECVDWIGYATNCGYVNKSCFGWPFSLSFVFVPWTY